MKILMVTAELTPFAKTGGLADMVSALSLALHKTGADVRIVMPRYYSIPREGLTRLEDPLGVPLAWKEEWTAVYTAKLSGKVTVFFIDHEQFFGRDGVYGSPWERDFHDNPLRFSLLCNGAFQLCRKLSWIPEVIHAHDWSGALAMPLLKFRERYREFKKTAGVFTIHNMGYQGIYPKDFFPQLGLPWDCFYASGFEDWDRINFLKAGISSAAALTTVSPTYAREIQSPESGFRLDGLLRARASCLSGILNGVDTEIWNPSKDAFLAKKYTLNTVSTGKAANKRALQERMGLEVSDKIPIIGIVTRLVDQKGVAELFAPTWGCMYRVCATMKVQVALLGSGEHWCESEILELQKKLPVFRAQVGYSEELSHLIEAGSDFFLMPSRYEPCGLNQMYSLLYGTLPIVRRTGGLADTVQNYDERTGEGTGFMFDNLTPDTVYDTVGWAVWAWYNKRDHITEMRKRGMAQKFGWDIAAKSYLQVYRNALGKH
ncbi:MAG: glycogen synthase GlgA [Spirochaetaceae bacterium]|jgi:starch synthase|nr:glycogen synthase GlgA [Spirochaetaceae bacterium]